jgi:hypothetical protein
MLSKNMASKSMRNFVILLGVDTLISIATGEALGIWIATVMSDILFTEGAVLLVAGGIAGIYAMSPSLNRVKKIFDDRYEARSGLKAGKQPETKAEQPDGKAAEKRTKIDKSALRIVTWAIVLLVLGLALAIVIVYAP